MTFFELQQYLKNYGSFIYSGDRLGDIELMEEEVKELFRLGMVEELFYRDARLLLMKERQIELKRRQ
ncbi:YqgQ family protein [Bacillus alkalicola]|uniref:YqgQ family protein n=2 Tax=Bacillales TaxID=1385 RepID=A0ABS6K044_9BACI|nr:YqgQ family protein [Bacillus alkalicola]